jgi:actin-related protein
MAGFAGEDLPGVVFPTVVGFTGAGDTVNSTKTYVGQKAFEARSHRLIYPFKAGRIIDWQAVRYIVSSIFDELQIPSSESKVLVSIPLLDHRENKEQLAEFLFNTLSVGNLSIFPRQPLAFLATRRSTGIVVDCELHHVAIVPMHKNFSIRHASVFLNPPMTTDSEIPYIAEQIVSVVSKTDADIHDELFDNIVLTGSYSTTAGFEKSLASELGKAIPEGTRVSIVAIPERLYLTWIGGSILAAAGSSQTMR